MSARHKRAPRTIMTPDNRIIPRDRSEHECWLALHQETKGGAFLFSRNGQRSSAVFVPAALVELGEPCGAILSTNWCRQPPQLERAVVYPVSGPGFIFDEKGLR